MTFLHCKQTRFIKKSAYFGLAALLSLSLFSGVAWSFEQHSADIILEGAKEAAPLITSPPVVTEDRCLSMLNAASKQADRASFDGDRRAASQAAALGLVFGVRFALGPKEVRSSGRNGRAVSFDLWDAYERPDSQALAVAAYRRCKKEQAVQALSNVNWGG